MTQPVLEKPPCDLVMKGGVTSGIVYPAAVCEIAQAFDIKSVGGTSAGAIAAGLTAAAQYRRVRARGGSDQEAGYERLAQIPNFLGADGRLGRLFAPNRQTKPLFKVVARVFSQKTFFSKVVAIAEAYGWWAALGAVPGIVLFIAAWNPRYPILTSIAYVSALLVSALGAAATAITALVRDLFSRIPANYFGLVTGVDGDNELALCTWLTRELELTAGLEAGDIPLTFGMLWDATGEPRALKEKDPPPYDKRAVNLPMVTTSLTEGRPYEFPMRTARYYFRSSELAPFFPPHVIKWLETNARVREADSEPLPDGMLALPQISDLPVIVATRMSLAFPLLLSAVPLYSIDHNDADPQKPQRVWFSDGGLTSNFPIAMYDAPLPRWPTLAINLGSKHPRRPDGLVLMSESTGDGQLVHFNKVEGLIGFGSTIFSTMQNWSDTLQSILPGFRDRIVTIVLDEDEGGLNLDMSAETIFALKERGTLAGKALVERFSAPSTLSATSPIMSWEGHRWTRFRVAFDTVARYLGLLARGWYTPPSRDVTYPDLVMGPRGTIPKRSFTLGGGSTAPGDQEARDLGQELSQVGSSLNNAPSLKANNPSPRPLLVVRSDLSK